MKSLRILISESSGEVSAEINEPKKMKALLVLAHGAGAGMNHRFMVQLSDQLAVKGIGTLRYNFPYMENGKKRPDVPAVATKTVEMVLKKANELFPKTAIFASGKSFGGRMSSQYLAKNSPDFVKGIIFYGFPLHPAGAPSIDRAEHLKQVKVPMLFLQGTRDALAELSLIKNVCSDLKKASLVLFEGADHSFKSGKREFITELVDATEKWVTEG
ncbi:MAG TPA: alpha/beta fold hydrolase [Cyclobacteriaceae bacterium]